MKPVTALAATLLCSALATLSRGAEDDSWIAVGQPFPLISLPLVGEGEKRAGIERYRGRKLMVHCFASW